MPPEIIVPRSLGLAGAHGLEVKGSERCWSYFHEAYCITVVSAGAGRWRYRHRDASISPRALMLMDPGGVHATTAVESPGDFLAIFLSCELMSELVEHLEMREPHFRRAADQSSALVEMFAGFARELAMGLDPAEQRERLSLCVARLLVEVGEDAPREVPVPITRVRKAARLLREAYEATPWQTVNVADMATAVGMSYHWLVHSFTREYGIPPYQFVQALRLARVRSLLARGPAPGLRSLSDVALAVGYADKSHLHRCVKRYLGVSPGDLAVPLNPRWGRGARSQRR